jgi:hypothetical protein
LSRKRPGCELFRRVLLLSVGFDTVCDDSCLGGQGGKLLGAGPFLSDECGNDGRKECPTTAPEKQALNQARSGCLGAFLARNELVAAAFA